MEIFSSEVWFSHNISISTTKAWFAFSAAHPKPISQVGAEKERGMREEKVGGRWMHWGMNEGEGRNQGRYK